MQDRRTLVYLDQDDIPASAVPYDGTSSESIAGNVVYLPCQNFRGSGGSWKIVSAGEYSSHIIDVDYIAYSNHIISSLSTCYYSNRANDYATSANYTWTVGCGTATTSKLTIPYNGLLHTSDYTVLSVLPSIIYGTSSLSIGPIILNKWFKVKFDKLVKVYKNGSPTVPTLPFYVDNE